MSRDEKSREKRSLFTIFFSFRFQNDFLFKISFRSFQGLIKPLSPRLSVSNRRIVFLFVFFACVKGEEDVSLFLSTESSHVDATSGCFPLCECGKPLLLTSCDSFGMQLRSKKFKAILTKLSALASALPLSLRADSSGKRGMMSNAYQRDFANDSFFFLKNDVGEVGSSIWVVSVIKAVTIVAAVVIVITPC